MPTLTIPEPAAASSNEREATIRFPSSAGTNANPSWIPGCRWDTLAVVNLLMGIWLCVTTVTPWSADLWTQLELARKLSLETPAEVGPWEGSAQVLAWSMAWAGWDGTFFLHAATICITFWLVLHWIQARCRSLGMAALLTGGAFLLAIPAIASLTGPWIALLSFGVILWSLTGPRRSAWRILLIPPACVAWVHTDPSWPLALVVLSGFAVAHVWPFRRTTRRATRGFLAWRYWWALALGVVSMSIHPSGWAVYVQIPEQLGLLSASGSHQTAPLLAMNIAGWLFGISVVFAVIACWRSKRRCCGLEIFLLLATGLAAAWNICLIPFWGVCWAWSISRHVVPRSAYRSSFSLELETSPIRTLIALATVFLALVWSPVSRAMLAGNPGNAASYGVPHTPMYLADEMKNAGYTGRVFASHRWQNYLAWSTDGHLTPWRPEGAESALEFQTVSLGGEGWFAAAQKHGVRYLALSPREHARLAIQAIKDSRCRLLYRDQQAFLFELLPDVGVEDTAGKSTFSGLNMAFATCAKPYESVNTNDRYLRSNRHRREERNVLMKRIDTTQSSHFATSAKSHGTARATSALTKLSAAGTQQL